MFMYYSYYVHVHAMTVCEIYNNHEDSLFYAINMNFVEIVLQAKVVSDIHLQRTVLKRGYFDKLIVVNI